jgi:hypothetical protein
MYEVKVGIQIKDDYFEAGTLIPEEKIPKKSKKWLLEQGVIGKAFDKKEFIKDEVKKDLLQEEE